MAARGQKRVLVLDTSVEGAQGIASTLEPSGLKVDWALRIDALTAKQCPADRAKLLSLLKKENLREGLQ